MEQPSKTGRESKAPTDESRRGKGDGWWEFCPICGTKLMNQKCKLVCPDRECGYFQSCSEFDT